MVATGDPYQLFTTPKPVQPSSGTVGDFLRNIFTVSPGGAPVTTTVPTQSFNAPTPKLAQTVQGPALPAANTLNLQDRAAIYNRAQMQAGLPVLQDQVSLPPARPNLPSMVQRTGLPSYDNQSALVRAPQGYTAPTKDQLSMADAVSNAYWAPYRRAQELQNRNLALKELEVRGKIAPKVPTLRDQLYGQAAEAAKALYDLDVAGVDVAPEGEKEKLRQAARKEYLKRIINIAQPKAAEAEIYNGQ